jgi:hypothetical protein
MRFLREILTDYDNKTFDTGRTLAVFVVVSMTILQCVSLFTGGTFDPMAYGGGVAAVIACLGVAIFGDSKGRP